MELQWRIKIFLTVAVVYCEVDASFHRAVVGSDVTLHCTYTHLPMLWDWSTLNVEWTRVNTQGQKQPVYTFEDGRCNVTRDGADVNKTGLLHNDASLKLPNISVRDEGLYTCRVIITPELHTGTATLKVFARPSVWLPEKAAILRGEEKLISRPLYRVCTEMEVLNADGTYSIRSGITVHSSVLKDGQIRLICQVEHQTFDGPLNYNVTLTQAVSEQYDAVILIAGTSVASVLLVLTSAAGAVLLLRHSKRKAMFHVPPNISDISQPSVTYADVENVLKCMISGMSRDSVESEAVSLLHWENLKEQASLESNGSHHTSILSLCLSTNEDRSVYKCVVHWKSQTFTRETTVHVKVQPSFLQISSIPQIPKVQRLLVLCCRVENFYPSDICLEWYRNDGEPVHPDTHYGPFSDHSHLYSMWSKIQLTMCTEDESAVYTCRVYHSSFSPLGYKDAVYHINTHGTPPNVMFIDCDPLSPALNTDCTLHLCIKDFCPKHITVTWTMDGKPVDSTCVFNTPPSLNINGLYSMYSFVKLISSQDQWNSCYRCRVEHSAQSQPEERLFILTDATPTPPL
ncbi:hypothetical protein WMY93_011177 [Mugilogobius chulae]|uniref:Ig-like domain-containing protein n=1 Tax=Mugilogobius chulae TaxID=88201 RepID=A0AAW0P539_9GOBI